MKRKDIKGTPPTHMRRLNLSRHRRKAGDFFVLSIRPFEFYWGRLISLDAIIGPWKRASLIYLYNACSATIEIRPSLSKENLLIPPIATFPKLWTQGYFLTVENEPLKSIDVFEKHCFYARWTDTYHDEQGHIVKERSEPCGQYALYSEIGIDAEISKALNLPMLDYFGRNNPT